MSKKHFKAIADIIANNRQYAFSVMAKNALQQNFGDAVIDEIVTDLCTYLSSENSRFDSTRFVRACRKDNQ